MKNREESLDERSRRILRELITEYCLTGEPVGSRTLSRRTRIDLSPATIRNVLADLEDAGYIQQPHTSAGRVPTDKGYRFFVSHLMRSHAPNSTQKELIENKMQLAGSMEDLLRLTADLLSSLTHNIALAIPPDLSKMTLEKIEFVLVSSHRVLAILITKGGVVTNKLVELDAPITHDELLRIANYIRTEFCGQTLPAIRQKIIDLMKMEQNQYDLLLKRAMLLSKTVMDSMTGREQLYVIGASQIVTFPEFADVARTRELLEALEQKSRILHILNECIDGEGIHILIGSENGDPELKGLSLISSAYKFDDAPIGTLGILGPTRMEYGRVIPLVDHIAKVVSGILTGSMKGRNE